MKKRILSMLLAVMLLCSSFPLHAFAVQAKEQESPYTVKMQAAPDTEMINVGDTVTVHVTVSSRDEEVKYYSSYDLKLHYDTKQLLFESANAPDADAEITAESGCIRVKGYGKDKAINTSAVTLIFRVKSEGETRITLEDARIDRSDNAGLQNAPFANVSEQDMVIKTGKFYTVSINGDGLIAESRIVSSSQDYFFRVEDPQLFNYKITVKVDDIDITDKLIHDTSTGTYTIPKAYITGDISLSASRIPKTFKVFIISKDITGANNASYLSDYSFTLNREKGYLYTITVTIGGNSYTGFTEKEDVYTIPGRDITGNIKITVVKEEDESCKVNVTFNGSGAKDASGEKKAIKEEKYEFTLHKAKGYTYTVSVSVGGKRVIYDYNSAKKIYWISGDKVIDDITITITKIPTVEVTEYITMNRESMYLILYRGNVGYQQVPKYDGKSMYWSDQYGCYVWLVMSEADTAGVKKAVEDRIAPATGSSAGALDYSGNVNLSLHTDMDDVQLIRDMYGVKYTLGSMEMLKFLNADVNGDRKVDIRDVTAVIHKISKDEVERT